MTAATLLPLNLFTGWLATGERGISSEAIVAQLTGVSISRWGGSDYPHDPSDFRRCQLLLRQVPLAQLAFGQMRQRGEVWARLVDAWDEIHEAIESEVPDYLDRHARGSAHAAYMLMARVTAGRPACPTCEGSGRAEACPKCKGTGSRSGGRCRNRGCYSGYFSCGACRGCGYIRDAAS